MIARLTPYELLLHPLEGRDFPAIRAEAEERRVDASDRDQILLLGATAGVLEQWVGEDTPPEAIDEFGELLFHGFEFWSTGRRLYLLSERTVSLLAQPSYAMADWALAAPPSSYLQLPYQRFWSRVSPHAPFEPVDGIFVATRDLGTGREGAIELRALMVLGLRPERPGISLIPARLVVRRGEESRFASPPWRGDGPPFANALPGGERKGYRAIVTADELTALVVRALHVLDTRTTDLRLREATPGGEASALPSVEVDIF
ncbi:MAG TPA: hypothetical protein VEI06_09950 [Gemmatimonadaceae bacterium]|nr:hypothetical protein [Gemmatimonadaceae bacterium]